MDESSAGQKVFNTVTNRRETKKVFAGGVHAHTPTFERCLKHLEAKGADPGAQHRMCYAVGAGGEGGAGAAKRKARFGRKS